MRQNKKAKRLNFHKGRQSHNPSQTNGCSSVQINSENAITKLRELAQELLGVVNPKGILEDLRIALVLKYVVGEMMLLNFVKSIIVSVVNVSYFTSQYMKRFRHYQILWI